MLTLTDKTNQTILHSAVDSSNVSAIKTLIELKIAENLINSKDEFSMTPMHLCGINFCKECYDLLMTLNPDISLKDSDGQTIIDYIESNEEIDENIKKEVLNKLIVINK